MFLSNLMFGGFWGLYISIWMSMYIGAYWDMVSEIVLTQLHISLVIAGAEPSLSRQHHAKSYGYYYGIRWGLPFDQQIGKGKFKEQSSTHGGFSIAPCV